jgi:predicted methyltransferase
MRTILATMLAATLLAGTGLVGCNQAEAPVAEPTASYSASDYGAAIADIARPQADRDADAKRLPGELLAFAQIDEGDVVGDYIMGGGYVTRLLAMAVGSTGKVYAVQPDEFIGFRPEYATEQDAAVAPYADNDGNPVHVFPLNGPIAAPPFPEPLDTIITVMNLHDLYIGPMPEGTADQAIAALYAALKPGGSLVVVDHRAAPGGGAEAADTLHRMDEELALADLTEAGFVLEEESEIYARPDDPRTANVFDEAIRGATDQFMWRLRKPDGAAGAE